MSDDQKKYDQEEVERLFFQMDTLFHTRVSNLLVAETIFFVAGATVWRDFELVFALCILGIITTLLFTFTNLKLYWRVTWLIHQMKLHSDFYKDYLAMRDIAQSPGRWGPVTRWLLSHLAPSDENRPQLRCLDTGWLYTWGLCIIALIGWIALLLISWRFHC